ncbi:MAG: aminotransferase class I/II-fold pyridoxal phosphate-dependent enzyme [Prevotella sp.]|nr:aminotransferase class I/II-fold pyridoxal phosphate-dependent enzyme [Prevotella sp.]
MEHNTSTKTHSTLPSGGEQAACSFRPADRLASIQEYYFSRKLKEVAKLNAEGKNIISLAIGSPDMPPAEHTIDVLCQEARKANAHGYQPTIGIPELRKAMADFYERWYGVELDPASEVQPLIGSKEGILHVTLAFVNPGDKVLVPNPGYPTYTSLSKLLGAEVVNYDLTEEGGWQPDFEQLEQMDLSRVKLMWTNYPHMPTGARARRETYERLVAFAKKHGIVIVNDNPYSFILNEGDFLSILQIPGAKDCCIEFNSLSKSHNMPGWRVAMLCSNAQFIQWILKVKTNVENGTFRAIQLAAADALTNTTDEWHSQANVRTYGSRRAIAEEIMRALGCTFDPEQTGMFLWGRIPDSYENVEDLTERVLHEARVFITPGFIFGSNGNRYVRISLCAKDEQMREALARIREMKNERVKSEK